MDIKMNKDKFKHDDGKLRLDLIETMWLKEIAQVMQHGLKKYPKDSWKLVEDKTNRYYAATLRHLIDWRSGVKNDKESNLNHLSHAAVNILFLLYFENNIKEVKNE